MRTLRLTLLSFLILGLFACTPLFAQSARIIEIKGRVSVKEMPSSKWRRARQDLLLYREAEIKTQRRSECTLAFDEDLDNLMTIKENSQVKIENIIPGQIYLPEGRVFSLIDNVAKLQDFQIRTPTAIAGVRGTGWSTAFNQNCTTASTFENNVNLQGLNKQGYQTGAKSLPSGFDSTICSDGKIGDFFRLGPGDYKEWGDFKDNTDDLRSGDDEDQQDDDDFLEDLKDEGRQDRHDDYIEDKRNDDNDYQIEYYLKE